MLPCLLCFLLKINILKVILDLSQVGKKKRVLAGFQDCLVYFLLPNSFDLVSNSMFDEKIQRLEHFYIHYMFGLIKNRLIYYKGCAFSHLQPGPVDGMHVRFQNQSP